MSRRGSFPNFLKKCGVVRGRISSFIFYVFSSHFFSRICQVLHRPFSRHASGFQIIFRPAGLVGNQKNSLLGVFFYIFLSVSVRFVMFCVNITLGGLQCFCVGWCCFDMFAQAIWRSSFSLTILSWTTLSLTTLSFTTTVFHNNSLSQPPSPSQPPFP